MQRRTAMAHLLGGIGALAGLALATRPAAGAAKPADKGKVVKITAQKYHYTPSEFTVKRGQTTILELTALDFTHGFKVPDLNIRIDLVPGKPIRVPITPDKTGVIDFLCDNFCGSGHEEMNGQITVVD